MKGDNPPQQYIPLYCSQPSKTRLDYEAEAELHYFPPIRDGNSTPLSPSIPACYSPPRSQEAQQTMNDSEDELSNFPSIKEGNDAPLVPPIPGRSRPRHPQAAQRGSKQPSQLRHRRQPNMGLGRVNIVNTVEALKRDSGIQDIADERPSKKQRVTFRDEDHIESVWHEIASLKARVEKVADEARDINSTLEELLYETR